MKQFILIALAVISLALSAHGGWYGQGEQKEKERRDDVTQSNLLMIGGTKPADEAARTGPGPF